MLGVRVRRKPVWGCLGATVGQRLLQCPSVTSVMQAGNVEERRPEMVKRYFACSPAARYTQLADAVHHGKIDRRIEIPLKMISTAIKSNE